MQVCTSSSANHIIRSHHLAPISGSINANEPPLAAAWRELTEETTLTPSNASHWRTGKPFTFTDPSINRQWTIHPFAFRLDSASQGSVDDAIRTDWEHESWGWFDPDAVVRGADHDGLDSVPVPRLRDSLRRVWFEGEMSDAAAGVLVAGLETLQRDHESGSQELTTIALGVFRDVLMQMRRGYGDGDGRLDEGWWASVRMAAWHLAKNGRESMGAAVMNALVSMLGDIDDVRRQQEPEQEDQKWSRILATVNHHLDARKDRTKKIRESFIAHLQSKHLQPNHETNQKIIILTLSASSTIRDSILDAFAALDHLQTLELRVLESRPLFEGVSIASSLLSQFKCQFQCQSPTKKLDIKIYTDASAALAAKDADVLLIGADRISSSKGVSNKTGSLPAVLSARYVRPSIEVAVLSDLEKVEGLNEAGVESTPEENDPVEVVESWHKQGVKGVGALEGANGDNAGPGGNTASVEVKNIYFEWVPLDLVNTFVCEQGVLKGSDIQEKARQIGETMEEVFGDL